MWLPLLGLVAGVLLGLALRFNLPIEWARYTAVGILAALALPKEAAIYLPPSLAAILTFGREVIRLGGSPLAEHGVGRNPVKQQLLLELYGRDGVEEMRSVKRSLDPDFKLAPGVLFER